LGKLMPLAMRADPLVNEICTGIGESSSDVQESMLEALALVFFKGGDKVTAPVRAKAVDLCTTSLLDHTNEATRRRAAAVIGASLRHGEAGATKEVLDGACTSAAAFAALCEEERDGKTAVVVSALKYAPAAVVPHLPPMLAHVLVASKDSEPTTRELAAKAIGYALSYSAYEGAGGASAGATVAAGAGVGAVKPPTSSSKSSSAPEPADLTPEVVAAFKTHMPKLAALLVTLLGDEHPDVRKGAIDAAKRFSRYSPRTAVTFSRELAPILIAFVTKEGGNSVLRFAAERALLYLTNVQTNETLFNSVLAGIEPTASSFLGDYARKVLRKAEIDSDDEDSDI